METCTGLIAAIKLRRAAPRPKVTLGDKVLALRQLRGGARARAEAQFLKDAEPFIRRCAAWYFGPDLDHDDVMATARLAVWSCVLDWDERLGAPFDTWARWKVRTELGKLLRGSRMVRGRAPEDFVAEADEVAAPVQDDAAAEVATALASLPSELRQVLEAVELDRIPIAEAAGRQGLDVATAKRRLSEGRDELRAAVLRGRRRGAPTPSNYKGGHGDTGARLSSNILGKP